jgi:hypothetical protein
LLYDKAEAGLVTTTVALNISAVASKTESLLFKASLLRFGVIAIETIPSRMPPCIPRSTIFSAIRLPKIYEANMVELFQAIPIEQETAAAFAFHPLV